MEHTEDNVQTVEISLEVYNQKWHECLGLEQYKFAACKLVDILGTEALSTLTIGELGFYRMFCYSKIVPALPFLSFVLSGIYP